MKKKVKLIDSCKFPENVIFIDNKIEINIDNKLEFEFIFPFTGRIGIFRIKSNKLFRNVFDRIEIIPNIPFDVVGNPIQPKVIKFVDTLSTAPPSTITDYIYNCQVNEGDLFKFFGKDGNMIDNITLFFNTI